MTIYWRSPEGFGKLKKGEVLGTRVLAGRKLWRVREVRAGKKAGREIYLIKPEHVMFLGEGSAVKPIIWGD